MRPTRPLLARRRALAVLAGTGLTSLLSACTGHERGGDARPGASSASAKRTQDLLRGRLIAEAVAREEALLDLCTAGSGDHGIGRVAAAAARDHRAHLDALHVLAGAASATGGGGGSALATPGSSPSAGSSTGRGARAPTVGVVASAESAWSADLLSLLSQAPADLRPLFASVAGAEASHAALLRGTS